jgi:hypothetical protein
VKKLQMVGVLNLPKRRFFYFLTAHRGLAAALSLLNLPIDSLKYAAKILILKLFINLVFYQDD